MKKHTTHFYGCDCQMERFEKLMPIIDDVSEMFLNAKDKDKLPTILQSMRKKLAAYVDFEKKLKELC